MARFCYYVPVGRVAQNYYLLGRLLFRRLKIGVLDTVCVCRHFVWRNLSAGHRLYYCRQVNTLPAPVYTNLLTELIRSPERAVLLSTPSHAVLMFSIRRMFAARRRRADGGRRRSVTVKLTIDQ